MHARSPASGAGTGQGRGGQARCHATPRLCVRYQDFGVMESDMVTLLVGIASTGTVVLAAGLGWIVKVLFDIRKDMHAMETRLARRIGAVETRVGAVETGLAVLAERIDERTGALRALVEDRTHETHARMDRIELRIDSMGRPAETREKAAPVPA